MSDDDELMRRSSSPKEEGPQRTRVMLVACAMLIACAMLVACGAPGGGALPEASMRADAAAPTEQADAGTDGAARDADDDETTLDRKVTALDDRGVLGMRLGAAFKAAKGDRKVTVKGATAYERPSPPTLYGVPLQKLTIRVKAGKLRALAFVLDPARCRDLVRGAKGELGVPTAIRHVDALGTMTAWSGEKAFFTITAKSDDDGGGCEANLDDRLLLDKRGNMRRPR